MTEQNVEGKQEQGSAAQDNVSDQLSQEASQAEVVTRADLDAVLKEVRGLQGKLDKDADAAAKRIQSNLESRLKQLGVQLTPEQQMQNRLLELEEQLASVGQGVAKPQPQTAEEPQKPVDIAKIKAAYSDIDFNSPQVLAAISQNLNNEDGLLAALGRVKVAGTDKPKPTGASTVSPSGNVSTSGKIEDLQAAYDKLLQGDPFDPEVSKKRKEIIKQMTELEQA